MKKIFALMIGVAAMTTATYATEVGEPEAAAMPEAPVEAPAPAPASENGWQKVIDNLPKISGYLQTG
ncbi:MAG: hypothetical protein IJ808_09425, partial [Muribaculaceae bacterium]|nr:hypothetical protein [Muribaculaceae bacterium]